MRILIADDDRVSRHILKDALSNFGYEVVVTKDGKEAWEILQRTDIQFMIADWVMPELDGLKLCRMVREAGFSRYIYFILLSAKGMKEEVVRGLSAGADDYMIKPINHAELKARVAIGERILQLEQRLVEAMQQMEYLATIDELSGLLNRRVLMNRLQREIKRSLKEQRPVSLIMADIDHFKMINDSYGHLAGDVILKEFAKLLMKWCRPSDHIGRYGGEEFLLVLPGISAATAERVAERLRSNLEKHDFEIGAKKLIKITASFGVATLLWDRPLDIDAFIKKADESMYAAKKAGRNCVCAADKELSAE